MIRPEEVYRIGKLAKPHGVKGEISFQFTDDVFDRSDECDYLVFLLDGIYVPFFIEEYRFKSGMVALMKFEGIDSVEAARQYVGVEVYFPKKYMVHAEDEGLSWNYFVGFKMEDKHLGMLGEIVEVDESTINTLFVVKNTDGDELLVPAQEAFILDMDHDERVMLMDLPEGMVDGGEAIVD